MICIDFSVYLFLTLLLLLVPLKWLLAAIFAAAIHELFHVFVIRLCCGKIHSIHIGLRGAKLDIAPLSPVMELLSAAAGPVGSFLLLMLAAWFPRLAICGFFQGCFNLLPIYPMDGGRVLRCIRDLWIRRKIPCKEPRIGVQ